MDSDEPAIGYTLRDQETLEVVKYGETTMAKKTHPTKYLKSEGVTMHYEETSTKREMHRWQHEKIIEYMAGHDGQRPRLNKSDH